MRDLPSGTVTFLFTDVEGSTKLLHELGAEAYADALGEHRRVIREACAAEGGVEVDTQGDAFFFAFSTAPGAIAAAEALTQALTSGPIQVRIGLHTGSPLLMDEGYVGDDVHRAARIAAAGHGGQVLVSASTAALIEPSDKLSLGDLGEHRLKDLSAAERIYQLGGDEFPQLKSLYRTNLPIPSTPFLGRERELEEVLALLERSRLLTLTGPGGTGKTRLALQAVATAADSFPDGVYWVPLAPLHDPSLVLPTASQAVGAKNGLSEHIQDKRVLVLFDNFEQVTDAAPGLSELLAACPNLGLVVTSREPLHLAAEQEYAVPSFVHEEAVVFFFARARAVNLEFQPDDAVSEICRRLDDLPLALELAAARVKALTSSQILERLERRLPLLTGGSLDAPERQRTLRATIEWSYELLSVDEQRLLGRLAVFRGGCSLEAAEDVVEADLDTLQSLVDKSLLRFTTGRYWMLETIREYAADMLGEASELERRHAEYYLALALGAEPELAGAAQADWLDRLDADHDNFRAALDWSLEAGEGELGLRMAHALSRLWQVRGHFLEGKAYVSKLLALDQPSELRALGLGDMAAFTLTLNELDEMERYTEERRRLCLELGDAEGANRALQSLGVVADARGDLDRAQAIYEEALAGFEHPVLVGVTLTNLGNVLRRKGQLRDAEARFEEAMRVLEPEGDAVWIAWVSRHLAGVRLDLDRRSDALPLLRSVLVSSYELRSPLGLAYVFDTAAYAAKDARQAARLLGKADGLREEVNDRQPHPAGDPYERAVETAVGVLGRDGFDAAYAEGQAMSLDDAIALALEVTDA